jgi:hypothetical protein
MSLKATAIKNIDNVIDARKEDIAKLLKLRRLVETGKAYFRASLYCMWKPFDDFTLEAQKSTLKEAIRSAIWNYHRATFSQWPERSRKKIKQGKCGMRMQVFVVDTYDSMNKQRIYDESLWWHHVETTFKEIWRTQPTRRRRA